MVTKLFNIPIKYPAMLINILVALTVIFFGILAPFIVFNIIFIMFIFIFKFEVVDHKEEIESEQSSNSGENWMQKINKIRFDMNFIHVNRKKVARLAIVVLIMGFMVLSSFIYNPLFVADKNQNNLTNNDNSLLPNNDNNNSINLQANSAPNISELEEVSEELDGSKQSDLSSDLLPSEEALPRQLVQESWNTGETVRVDYGSFNKTAKAGSYEIKYWDHIKFATASGANYFAGDYSDVSGLIYFTNYGNDRVDYYDKNLNFIGSFGTSGSGNGQLDHPNGIEINSTGYIYIVDYTNNRYEIFDSSYSYSSQFSIYHDSFPDVGDSIAINSTGYLYSMELNSSNSEWSLVIFDAVGNYQTEFLTNCTYDITGIPYGIDISNDGQFVYYTCNYVESSAKHSIIKQDAFNGTIYTVYDYGASPDILEQPYNVHIDSIGNVYMGQRGTTTCCTNGTVFVFDEDLNLIDHIEINNELYYGRTFVIDDEDNIYVYDHYVSGVRFSKYGLVTNTTASIIDLSNMFTDNGITSNFVLNHPALKIRYEIAFSFTMYDVINPSYLGINFGWDAQSTTYFDSDNYVTNAIQGTFSVDELRTTAKFIYHYPNVLVKLETFDTYDNSIVTSSSTSATSISYNIISAFTDTIFIDYVYSQTDGTTNYLRSDYKYIGNNIFQHKLDVQIFEYRRSFTIYAPLNWNYSSISPTATVTLTGDNYVITNTIPVNYEVLFLSGTGFGRDFLRKDQILALKDVTSDYLYDPSLEKEWSRDWWEHTSYPFDSITFNHSVVSDGISSIRLTDTDGDIDGFDYYHDDQPLEAGEYYISFDYYFEDFTAQYLDLYIEWNGAWTNTWHISPTYEDRWNNMIVYVNTEGNYYNGIIKQSWEFLYIGGDGKGTVFLDNFKVYKASGDIFNSKTNEYYQITTHFSYWSNYGLYPAINEYATQQILNRPNLSYENGEAQEEDAIIDDNTGYTDSNGNLTWNFKGKLLLKEYALRSFAWDNHFTEKITDENMKIISSQRGSDTYWRNIGGSADESFDSNLNIIVIDYTATATTFDIRYYPASNFDLSFADIFILEYKVNTTTNTPYTDYWTLRTDTSNESAWYSSDYFAQVDVQDPTLTYKQYQKFGFNYDPFYEIGIYDETNVDYLDFRTRSSSATAYKFSIQDFHFIQAQYVYFNPLPVGSYEYGNDVLNDQMDFAEDLDGFTAGSGGTLDVVNGYLNITVTAGISYNFIFTGLTESTNKEPYYNHIVIRIKANQANEVKVYPKDSVGGFYSPSTTSKTLTTDQWTILEWDLSSNDDWKLDHSIIFDYRVDNGSDVSPSGFFLQLDYDYIFHKEDVSTSQKYNWEFSEFETVGYFSDFESENNVWEDTTSNVDATVDNGVITITTSNNYRGIQLWLEDLPNLQGYTIYFKLRTVLDGSGGLDLYFTLRDGAFGSSGSLIEIFYSQSSVSSDWTIYSHTISSSTPVSNLLLETADSEASITNIWEIDWIRIVKTDTPNLIETDTYFYFDNDQSINYEIWMDDIYTGSFASNDFIYKNLSAGNHKLKYMAFSYTTSNQIAFSSLMYEYSYTGIIQLTFSEFSLQDTLWSYVYATKLGTSTMNVYQNGSIIGVDQPENVLFTYAKGFQIGAFYNITIVISLGQQTLQLNYGYTNPQVADADTTIDPSWYIGSSVGESVRVDLLSGATKFIRSLYKYTGFNTFDHYILIESQNYGEQATIYFPIEWSFAEVFPIVPYSITSNNFVMSNLTTRDYIVKFFSGNGFGQDYTRRNKILAIKEVTDDYLLQPNLEAGYAQDYVQNPTFPFDSLSINYTIVSKGLASLRLEDADGSADEIVYNRALPSGYYYVSYDYYIESSSAGLRYFWYDQGWNLQTIETSYTNRWLNIQFYIHVSESTSYASVTTNFIPFSTIGAYGVYFFDNIQIYKVNTEIQLSEDQTLFRATMNYWNNYGLYPASVQPSRIELRERSSNTLLDYYDADTTSLGRIDWYFKGILHDREYELRATAFNSYWNPIVAITKDLTDTTTNWQTSGGTWSSDSGQDGDGGIVHTSTSSGSKFPTQYFPNYDFTEITYVSFYSKYNGSLSSIFFRLGDSQFDYYDWSGSVLTTSWDEYITSIDDDWSDITIVDGMDRDDVYQITFRHTASTSGESIFIDQLRFTQSQKFFFTPQTIGSSDYFNKSFGDSVDFSEGDLEGITEAGAGSAWTVQDGYFSNKLGTTSYSYTVLTVNSLGSHSIDGSYYNYVQMRVRSNDTKDLFRLNEINYGLAGQCAQSYATGGLAELNQNANWQIFEIEMCDNWKTEISITSFRFTFYHGNSTNFYNVDGNESLDYDWIRVVHKDSSIKQGLSFEFDEDGYEDGGLSGAASETVANGWYKATMGAVTNDYITTTSFLTITNSDDKTVWVSVYTLETDLQMLVYANRAESGTTTSATKQLQAGWNEFFFDVNATGYIYQDFTFRIWQTSGNMDGTEVVIFDWIRITDNLPDYYYEADSYFLFATENSYNFKVWLDSVPIGTYASNVQIAKNTTVGTHTIIALPIKETTSSFYVLEGIYYYFTYEVELGFALTNFTFQIDTTITIWWNTTIVGADLSIRENSILKVDSDTTSPSSWSQATIAGQYDVILTWHLFGYEDIIQTFSYIIVELPDFEVTIHTYSLSDLYVNIFVTATRFYDYNVYENDLQVATGSGVPTGTFISHSRDLTSGALINLAYKFTNTSDIIWFNTTYSNAQATSFSISVQHFTVTDQQSVLSFTSTLTGSFIVYENDTSVGSGSVTAGLQVISLAKVTTPDTIVMISYKFTNSSDIWFNSSYSNPAKSALHMDISGVIQADGLLQVSIGSNHPEAEFWVNDSLTTGLQAEWVVGGVFAWDITNDAGVHNITVIGRVDFNLDGDYNDYGENSTDYIIFNYFEKNLEVIYADFGVDFDKVLRFTFVSNYRNDGRVQFRVMKWNDSDWSSWMFEDLTNGSYAFDVAELQNNKIYVTQIQVKAPITKEIVYTQYVNLTYYFSPTSTTVSVSNDAGLLVINPTPVTLINEADQYVRDAQTFSLVSAILTLLIFIAITFFSIYYVGFVRQGDKKLMNKVNEISKGTSLETASDKLQNWEKSLEDRF